MNGKEFMEMYFALKNLRECVEKRNEIKIHGTKYNCKNIDDIKKMLLEIRNYEMILIGNMYQYVPRFRTYFYGNSISENNRIWIGI